MTRRWLITGTWIARGLFYLAAGGFFVVAGYVLWPLRPAIQETHSTVADVHAQVKPGTPNAKNIARVILNAAVVTDETAKASTAQKEYFTSLKKGTDGLIGEARTTVKSLGTAADNIGGAAASIGGVADTAKRQMPETFQRVNGVLGDAGTTLLTANTQLREIGPLLRSSARLVDDAGATMHNKELAASLVNFQRISAAWAGTSEDVQTKVHQVVYPDCHGLWKGVKCGLQMALPAGQMTYYLSPFMH